MFNPYRDWLEIPLEQQPPTYYRLLGVAPNEANLEAIKEAALLQTTRVRMYQTGPQAQVCTRVLNEIAQARAVLVNPKTRNAYDVRLATPRSAVESTPAVEPAPAVESAPLASQPTTSEPPPRGPRPDRVVAAIGYCCLLLCGFGISFCLTFQSVYTAARAAAEEQHPAHPEEGLR